MTYSELFLAIKERQDWEVVKDEKHELQFSIVSDKTHIFLLFQESNGKRDWRDNFNIFPNRVTCCSGKVVMSEGINLAYKCGRAEVRARMADARLKNPDAKIVTAGWSHGGGVAVRACIDLNHEFGWKPALVTYGAPAVLWGKDSSLHAWQCCSSAVQWAHKNDIVTKVAPGAEHVDRRQIGTWIPFGDLNPWYFHTKYDHWCANFDFMEV